LMPHFGQKTGFRARMNEIKSGIPCSGLEIAQFVFATLGLHTTEAIFCVCAP
jgi:hypothetical protein